MNPVLIIHGWSDDSKSFEPLANALKVMGFNTVPLWLGDYLSMQDEVTIADVAKRMEEVIAERIASGELGVPFDMIVHSTGGLIARQWLAAFDTPRSSRYLQRLVMLAPANYGSRLASIGKSMLGRLVKGFDNWFETGTQMLNALELASPYQWQLSLADVLQDPSTSTSAQAPFHPAGCLPFVITGIKGYDALLRRPLNEDGADGTVRAAAANLTSYGATLDFSTGDAPRVVSWNRVGPLEQFAFVTVRSEDHTSVKSGSGDAFAFVLEALGCPLTADDYQSLVDRWSTLTEAALDGSQDERHQFFQLNTYVVDDLGQPVPDHFLEFFSATGARRDAALSVFQSEVIKHVHVNSVNAACRNFYMGSPRFQCNK